MPSRTLLARLFLLVPLVLLACGRSDLSEDLLSGGDAGPDGQRPDGGRACSIATECDDGNPCTQELCQAGRCQYRPTDNDNDGFVSAQCGGNDCDDTDPAVNPSAKERCAGGADDNCDGLVDCADPTCKGQPGCVCGPVEICGNGIDDNCDGKSDCQDSACKSNPSCQNCGPAEICGNGVDDDCNGKVDCQDTQCALLPQCRCNQPESCTNGTDDNCDGKIDCQDPQCSGNCRCAVESCGNGKDDNCDGLIDCADPECNGRFECSCNGRPPQPERCGDGIDNDCDGRKDCGDPDCFTAPECRACTQEVCGDGADNDCDGKIDCADDACVFAPNCRPQQEVCDDGRDNDLDGLIDCFDTDCRTNPFCTTTHSTCISAMPISASGTYTGNTTGFVGENAGSCGGASGEAIFQLVITAPSKVHLDTRGSSFDTTLYVRAGACRGGRELACDDDSGGSRNTSIDFTILYPGTYFVFVDGFTVDPRRGPDQGAYALNVSITQNPKEVCDNGLDDDGDRYVDCADPQCATAPNCLNCAAGGTPKPEFGVAACNDGVDNDCDGLTDGADKDCHASDYYTTEFCNGRDDNGNGIIDDFSCRCATSADCPNGQICYTHSVFACGPRCDGFVGDVCPFVAPGSTCGRTTTRECEFP